MKCETCGSELSGMQPQCPFCGTPDPVFARRYRQYPPPPPRNNMPQNQYQQNMYPPPQNTYPPPQNMTPPPFMFGGRSFDSSNDPAEGALILLSILCPLVGLIFGIKCLSDGEKRAGKAYLIAACVSFGLYILIVFAGAFLSAFSSTY